MVDTLARTLAPRTAWRAAAWYLVLTVAMLWPLAPGIARDIPWDLGDSLLNCWILGWNAERLLRVLGGDVGALHGFYDANIFHPEPLALAYSETLFAQTLQILPVYAATGNLILCYNLLIFSTYVLSGLGAYLLVRDLTGDWRAGFAAGVCFAFVPWRVAQMPHMQVLSTQWMPLAMYGVRRYLATGRVRALAGGTLALVLNNHSNGYYLLFFAPFFAAYVLWEMATRGLLSRVRTWIGVLTAATVTGTLTVPFLLPYVWLRERSGTMRSREEVESFAADVLAYVTTVMDVRLVGPIVRALPRAEGDLFPGFTPTLLAFAAIAFGTWRAVVAARRDQTAITARAGRSPRAAAVARWAARAAWLVIALAAVALLVILIDGAGRHTIGPFRIRLSNMTRTLWALLIGVALLAAASPAARRRISEAWRSPIVFFVAFTLLAAWLSLGPTPQTGGRALNGPALYAFLYDHVPGFDGLRVPARFAALVMLGLSVLAGYGARDLLRRGMPPAALALVVAFFLAEATAAPIPMNLSVADREGAPPAAVAPSSRPPAVYRYVASLPPGAVLVELPFGDTSWELQHVYYSTTHWRPMLNGYSGGFPRSYLTRRAVLDDPLRSPDQAWAALASSPATHLVLHGDAYPATQDALRRWLEGHGARLAAQFDEKTVYVLR